jgi:hypothetical protein
MTTLFMCGAGYAGVEMGAGRILRIGLISRIALNPPKSNL